MTEAVATLNAEDLWLSCACVMGHTGAVVEFETAYMPVVTATVRGMRADQATADDIAQEVRERLLVGSDHRKPRIADYAGRGDLRRWLKAIAVRTFLNSRRGAKREVLVDDAPVLDALAQPIDPQTALVKEKYRGEFAQAFATAMASLSDQDKMALRYAHIDNLNLEAIGRALGVSRATAHRRLVRAREALAAATERELATRLHLAGAELQSIRRLVQSQVVVSVRRLLSP